MFLTVIAVESFNGRRREVGGVKRMAEGGDKKIFQANRTTTTGVNSGIVYDEVLQ